MDELKTKTIKLKNVKTGDMFRWNGQWYLCLSKNRNGPQTIEAVYMNDLDSRGRSVQDSRLGTWTDHWFNDEVVVACSLKNLYKELDKRVS